MIREADVAVVSIMQVCISLKTFSLTDKKKGTSVKIQMIWESLLYDIFCGSVLMAGFPCASIMQLCSKRIWEKNTMYSSQSTIEYLNQMLF